MRAATLDSARGDADPRYRIRGHLLAQLDSLSLEDKPHPELDPATYGFTDEDWDRPIFITHTGLETASLREIVDLLRKTQVQHHRRQFTDQTGLTWIQERTRPSNARISPNVASVPRRASGRC